MKFYLGLLLLLAVSCHFHEDEEINLEGINWDGVLRCLSDAAPLIPEIYDLVQLIRARQFGKALTKAIDLIQKGFELVRTCINRFKTPMLGASPHKKKKHFNPCFFKCRKELNITWSEAKTSPEFKKCAEECKAEWEKKIEEKKEEIKKCLEECEPLKEEGEVIKRRPAFFTKKQLTPYQKCAWKCKRQVWKKKKE